MSFGARIGAHIGARKKGHTCKCPRCGKKRYDCTKACYNYRCPKCKSKMVRVK